MERFTQKIVYYTFFIVALLMHSGCTDNCNTRSSSSENIERYVAYAYNPLNGTYIVNDSVMHGVYGNVKFVKTRHNAMLEEVLRLTASVDVPEIFNISDYNQKTRYMLVSHRQKRPYMELGLHIHGQDEFSDTIKLSSVGETIVYIVEESILYPTARYCFVYNGTLLFTHQWILDLFVGIQREQQVILDYPLVGDTELNWTFVFKNDRIESADVRTFGYEYKYIPFFDILQRQYHEIPRQYE